MKYYKLLNNCFEYKAGEIFNFNAKHHLMNQLSFQEQRNVTWLDSTKEEAMANSYNYVLDDKIVNFMSNEFSKHLH